MRFRVFVHLVVVATLVALSGIRAPLAADSPVVRIGVLGVRPLAEEKTRWQPLVDYLNSNIHDYRFVASYLGYNDLELAIAERAVDFVLTNPGHYVLMTRRNGMSSPLATLVALERDMPVATFGGVIFTRADREDIRQIADLRNRTVAAVSKGSLGGYQAQALTLLNAGLEIPADVHLILTDMPHDNIVAAVLDGRADAGFVRTGLLEQLAHEGRVDVRKLRLLNLQHPVGFPFMVSTRLYPEWPFAAMPDVDSDLARRVAAALLGLPHGGELARQMGIRGFNVPADYEPVREVLEALRLPPYEAAPNFTLADIWQKYRWQLAIGLALSLVIAALSLWLLALNRRLAWDRQQIDAQAREWQGLLTALGDGVFGIDANGLCSFINPAALEMLGLSERDVIGYNPHDLFHHTCAEGAIHAQSNCPVFKSLSDHLTRHEEDWFMHRDGTLFPVTITATPVKDRTGREGVVVVFRNISDQKRLESALREEAATDPLTGLPNRRYFLAEMERHWARITRGDEAPAAVMMLDIDEFKAINDAHGHDVGDEVLRHLAELVRETLRLGDLVGRLGGEEFAILQVDATPEDARRMADRIRQRVEATTVQCGGRDIRYTLSIGVTLMVRTDHSVRIPLQRADAALYRAKGNGRNRMDWEAALGT